MREVVPRGVLRPVLPAVLREKGTLAPRGMKARGNFLKRPNI